MTGHSQEIAKCAKLVSNETKKMNRKVSDLIDLKLNTSGTQA